MATTWYVNGAGAATNGFLAIGNDTTGNGTKALPYLTIDKAQTVGTTGDTIYCNSPANYSENTGGNNYLSVTKGITIATEPGALTASGKAGLQASAASRVVNMAANNASIQDFVIDAQATNKNAAAIQANTGMSFVRVDIKNIGGASNGLAMSAASASLTLDKVTLTSGNGNNASANFVSISGATCSLIIKGCTFSGCAGFLAWASNVATTLVRCQASSDGTRNTVSSCTGGIKLPNATVTMVDIQAVDFNAVSGGNACIWDNTTTTATTTNFNVQSCSFAGLGATVGCVQLYGNYTSPTIQYNLCTSPVYLVDIRGIGCSSPVVNNNTYTATSSTKEAIQILACSGQPEVKFNTISTDTSNHVFIVGCDGTNLAVSQTTSSGTINLGDISGRTYVAEKFAFIAGTGPLNSKILACLRVPMKKTGTPLGSVTCYLYTDNAGAPGTLIDTSEYSMLGANQPASPLWVEFWFPTHNTLTYSANYWIVLKYNGTIDGTNYVTLSGASAGTTVQVSTDGLSWGAGAGPIMYQVRTAAFEITNPLMHDNKITVTASATPHGCFVGGTLGGKIYNNQVYGGGIPLIMKLVDGSGANIGVISTNLVWDNVGSQQAIRLKGCRGIFVAQNTADEVSTLETAITLDNDYESTTIGGLTQYNGQADGQGGFPSVVKNNIFYCTSPSGTSPIYQIGSTTAAQPTSINPVIDNNNIYIGANTVAGYDYRSGSQVVLTTFAQWQAAGNDGSGINANQLLANATAPTSPADFVPASLSPCVGVGSNLSAIVPSDFYGNTFTIQPPAGAIMPYNLWPRVVSPARASTTR